MAPPTSIADLHPRSTGSLGAKLRALRESDPRLIDLILLYLAVKLGLLMVLYLGSQLIPFNWQLYNTNLVMDLPEGLPGLLRGLNTWDTQHYVLLSQHGYGFNAMSNAFYPLYPYLIWIFTPLTFNHPLLTAYLISNVCSLLVPVYMYKLCCLFYSSEQAFRATVLLMAFPTAFFLSVAYTEALYLSLCLIAFYYLFKEDVLRASLACFLLPLTRAQGLLFVAPAGVLFLQAAFRSGKDSRAGMAHAVRTYAPPLCATLLGMASYFAICRWQLGGFFAGFAAQRSFAEANSLANVFFPHQWFLRNFVNIQLQLHNYGNSIMDRVAFVLCAPLLIGIYRTQHKALFVYAAVSLLVPALSGTFMSYTRMLLVVFPLFIYLGTRFRRSLLLGVPTFILQVFCYLLHTGGYWVA